MPRALAFSADGKRIAVAETSETVLVINVKEMLGE